MVHPMRVRFSSFLLEQPRSPVWCRKWAKSAMISKVAEGAGLDPEGNPEDRALSERLAAELVEVGYASAEAGSSGFLVITPEGEQALKGGASRNDSLPPLS